MGSKEVYPSNALAGGTVLGTYEIGAVLGRGGFGLVYKALHQELGTAVAIKEFFPSELAERHSGMVQPRHPDVEEPYKDGLRRFLEEAKRLEAFRDCPSIVSCRDLFRANGTAYMVMDYVHGLPLSTLLERREASAEPFTEQDLLDVIEPLLAGLQVVHASGVYHRDIKPSNILIRHADNRPVLVDFGAAKQETAGLTKSMAPYTDGYAAMEQVGEGDIGSWTDIYGVGAVMWRMVAGGAPPFDPPNPVPVQRRAYEAVQGGSDPMPTATRLGAGRFTDGVLGTIDACVKISTSERIQSCDEVQQRIGTRGNSPLVAASLSRGVPRSETLGLLPAQNKLSEDFTPPTSRLKRYARGWCTTFCIALTVFVCSLTSAIINEGPFNTSLAAVSLPIVSLSGAFWGIRGYRLGRLKRAHAEFKTGVRYFNGEGVQQDEREAFKWYLLAAEKGHADAQFNLGTMYEQGTGVKQDFHKADAWHRKFSKNKFR